MSLLGAIIHRGARLGAKADQPRLTPPAQQKRQLLALLRHARFTEIGQAYNFSEIFAHRNPVIAFRQRVPALDYNGMYDRWWHKAHLLDQPNVCWPGLIPYFALSSGTSQASTKYIPITLDQLRMIRRCSRRLFFSLSQLGLPSEIFQRQMLMVGSCTNIRREGKHHTGDVSGIMGHHRPLWMERYYRPGRHITSMPEWGDRIEAIAQEAPRWNIGFAVANPMWMQMILEKIIERYHLQHIHDLWPDFSVFAYGGVFFEPYRPRFEQLMGRPMHYINTYMASEGFFASQSHPDNPALKLISDAGIYFEFVPFDDRYFDENGDLKSEFPEALSLAEAQNGIPYAMLLTTCAGAWRYLLGDTIQFSDVRNAEFRLTGRTKQFLSTCGEHLSIDNLNDAVRAVDAKLQICIQEFTVAGIREGSYWAHQWYISAENCPIPAHTIAEALDRELCRLNEDYAVERQYALRNVRVELLTNQRFFDWLRTRNKMNGQAKIPRVLKGQQLTDFQDFLRVEKALT